MISKTISDLIKSKAVMAVGCYPKLGITIDDLINLTIEFCQDDYSYPSRRTVKAIIKRSGFIKRGHRYFQA